MPDNKQTKTPTEAVFAVGEAAMRQMEDAGLGPLHWMGTAWCEAAADMQSELATFIADRIKEDVKTQHALLHCKSAEELQQAQLAFLERAYVQYTTETGKLIQMTMDMLPGSTSETEDTPV